MEYVYPVIDTGWRKKLKSRLSYEIEKLEVKALNYFGGLGKTLLVLGLILAIVGGGLMLLPKIPWIGKLPGDIFIKGEKVSFYFPITTCIIISLLLTLLFSLFKR
jgi:hypothetical protein